MRLFNLFVKLNCTDIYIAAEGIGGYSYLGSLWGGGECDGVECSKQLRV